MMKLRLLLIFLGLCQELVAATRFMPMEHLIPSNAWYTPPLYPNMNPSYKLNYNDMECKTIESGVSSFLENQRSIGGMSDDEVSKIKSSFQDCWAAMCDDAFIRRKFADQDTMIELFLLMKSKEKFFPVAAAYEVFAYLVDPRFLKFIRDIPYPLVEDYEFEAYGEAASNIIQDVCGSRPREEDVDMGVVSRIFHDILIDHYIENAFIGEEVDTLVAERNMDDLKDKWNVAAGYRARDYCFDTARFYSQEERATVTRVRKTAQKLGIDCGGIGSGASEATSAPATTTPPLEPSTEFSFELGAPPSGPSGGGGAAPGAPGDSGSNPFSGGAPGAPSSYPVGPPM